MDGADSGRKGNIWASGSWADTDLVADYRSEWLGGVLVERATFSTSLASGDLVEVITQEGRASNVLSEWITPGSDLVRFWLIEYDQIVDKAFDSRGEALGCYVPVAKPLEREGDRVLAYGLYLGLKIEPGHRVTVTGEAAFEQAVARGTFTPVEVEHAEHRIRYLTTLVASSTLPPALVRNFTLVKDAAR